mmetsp:Transcript_2577/g.7563  ORF Transcript_2577/g.7563 Transcript_2577/m.7563 type:complete len:369 (-) Transcript_2577:73-1179(-)
MPTTNGTAACAFGRHCRASSTALARYVLAFSFFLILAFASVATRASCAVRRRHCTASSEMSEGAEEPHAALRRAERRRRLGSLRHGGFRVEGLEAGDVEAADVALLLLLLLLLLLRAVALVALVARVVDVVVGAAGARGVERGEALRLAHLLLRVRLALAPEERRRDRKRGGTSAEALRLLPGAERVVCRRVLRQGERPREDAQSLRCALRAPEAAKQGVDLRSDLEVARLELTHRDRVARLEAQDGDHGGQDVRAQEARHLVPDALGSRRRRAGRHARRAARVLACPSWGATPSRLHFRGVTPAHSRKIPASTNATRVRKNITPLNRHPSKASPPHLTRNLPSPPKGLRFSCHPPNRPQNFHVTPLI